MVNIFINKLKNKLETVSFFCTFAQPYTYLEVYSAWVNTPYSLSKTNKVWFYTPMGGSTIISVMVYAQFGGTHNLNRSAR